MNKEILALTDDLTCNQFQDLLIWHWTYTMSVTTASIKKWRELKGLK